MNFTSFLPGIIWFIISAVLLTIPGNDLPHNNLFNIPFFDKYVHFAMFFMLTTLFCYPFFHGNPKQVAAKTSFNKVSVYVILYGIVMEYVQKYLVSARSFDFVDIVFDTTGSLTGLFVVRQFYAKKIGPNRNRGRNQN